MFTLLHAPDGAAGSIPGSIPTTAPAMAAGPVLMGQQPANKPVTTATLSDEAKAQLDAIAKVILSQVNEISKPRAGANSYWSTMYLIDHGTTPFQDVYNVFGTPVKNVNELVKATLSFLREFGQSSGKPTYITTQFRTPDRQIANARLISMDTNGVILCTVELRSKYTGLVGSTEQVARRQQSQNNFDFNPGTFQEAPVDQAYQQRMQTQPTPAMSL